MEENNSHNLEDLRKQIKLAKDKALESKFGSEEAKASWSELEDLYMTMIKITSPFTKEGKKIRYDLISTLLYAEQIDKAWEYYRLFKSEMDNSPS